MYYIEFPDFSFDNENSLVIYIDECNMKCRWCSYKELFKIMNVKKIEDYKEIIDFIQKNKNYIKKVIFSGGEPLIRKNEIKEIAKECKRLKIKTVLFTNLLLFDDSLLEYFDFIVTDLKGTNIKEIKDNTGLSDKDAKNLYDKYQKYKNNKKFKFRCNDRIVPDEIFDVEIYTSRKL